MRKIFLLLAAICCQLLLRAQTLPIVNFTVALDPTINHATFTNTSQHLGDGVKKAIWIFGDGSWAVTGAANGTQHTYAAAGTYQVCLKIYRYPGNSNDSVLIGSECKSMTIAKACVAGIKWADSVADTKPTRIIQFSGYGSSNPAKIVKYVCWKFGDGTDSCMTVPAGTLPPAIFHIWHQYREPGAYTACIRVVFDGGCVGESCTTVMVPKPGGQKDSCSANFILQSISATPLGRRFVAQPWNSHQKKPLRICWSFGDGKDSCIQYTSSYAGDYRVEHHYANYGHYEACVSIRYDGGCETRKCNGVNIEQITPPTTCEASVNEAATNLASLERRFYAGLQANRAAEKICWKFGDGTDTCINLSSPLNPLQLAVMHRYPAPGAYSVCIRVVYAGGCVAERCRAVEIRFPHKGICGAYITDSVVAANTVRLNATSIHGPNEEVTGYLWTFGDGSSATEREVRHAYAAPGAYTACVNIKTTAGCETKVCKKIVIEGNAHPLLVLTPNPVVSTLTAVFQSVLSQTMLIRIYNSNGLLLKTYSRNAVMGANTWTFDLGGLQTGVYSMVVQSANQFATAIFFKQ